MIPIIRNPGAVELYIRIAGGLRKTLRVVEASFVGLSHVKQPLVAVRTQPPRVQHVPGHVHT